MNRIPVILITNKQAPTQLLKAPCYGQKGGSWVGQEELERRDLLADWLAPGASHGAGG